MICLLWFLNHGMLITTYYLWHVTHDMPIMTGPFWHIGTSGCRSSWSTLGQLTGNNVIGHYFPVFSHFFLLYCQAQPKPKPKPKLGAEIALISKLS